jgi:peptidoglycan/LPS O-acetylase OafA/YrhL
MKRRIIRIVPLYWFYTALKIVLVLLLPTLALRTKLEPGHILASFFFFPTMSPWGGMEPVLPVGWTLMFEMLFYVIFAAAIALKMPRMIFSMAIFGLLHVLYAIFPESSLLAFYARSVAFEFVLGIAIAHCVIRRWTMPRPVAVIALVVGGYLLFEPTWWAGKERFTTLGLAVGVVVWAVISLEGMVRSIPAIRFFAVLGDASYSTYLSHAFVVPLVVTVLMRKTQIPWMTVALITCLAAILVGYLSYIWLESPMTHRLKRWADPRRP